MRFATWNLKQAIAPKKPIADLWSHTATDIDPHVMVFTEAKVPKDGVPSGWTAQWKEGGIGHRRRWGTILAGRGVELRPITHVGSWRQRPFKNSWPAALAAAEVIVGGRSWGAVIGIYGMLVDAQGERVGSGRISVPLMLEEVAPIVRAHRNVVVAGDFNIWPNDKPRILDRLGLVDVVEATADQRPPLDGCCGCTLGSRCGHMWTHRNGNGPNAAVQQIDFVFASTPLARQIRDVRGGVRDFPQSWELSDHAPVVVDFEDR